MTAEEAKEAIAEALEESFLNLSSDKDDDMPLLLWWAEIREQMNIELGEPEEGEEDE